MSDTKNVAVIKVYGAAASMPHDSVGVVRDDGVCEIHEVIHNPPPASPKLSDREMEPLLGTMYDHELAKLAGVSRDTIRRRRDRAGIPPFDRRGSTQVHVRLDETHMGHLRSLQEQLGGVDQAVAIRTALKLTAVIRTTLGGA